MTNPQPIKDPRGVVYAYACGHCRHLLGGMSSYGIYDDETIAHHAEHSRYVAETCCVCFLCGKVELDACHFSMCAECKEATKAERAAADAAWLAEREAEAATYNGTLDKALDRDAALALEAMISEISEDTYCAGWLSGIEDDLWRHLDKPGFKYGMGRVEERDLKRMRALAEKAGGWWRHREFVPMDEWLSGGASRREGGE